MRSHEKLNPRDEELVALRRADLRQILVALLGHEMTLRECRKWIRPPVHEARLAENEQAMATVGPLLGETDLNDPNF